MINWSWYLLICAFFPFLGDGGKRRANVRIPPKANVAVLLHHLRHDDRHQDYQCHDHLYHHHHHQIASPYDTRNMHSLASHTRPCTFPRRRSGPVPEQKEEKMVIISVENIDDENYYISLKFYNKNFCCWHICYFNSQSICVRESPCEWEKQDDDVLASFFVSLLDPTIGGKHFCFYPLHDSCVWRVPIMLSLVFLFSYLFFVFFCIFFICIY